MLVLLLLVLHLKVLLLALKSSVASWMPKPMQDISSVAETLGPFQMSADKSKIYACYEQLLRSLCPSNAFAE